MTAAPTQLVRVDDAKLPVVVDKAALKSFLGVIEDPEMLQLQNRLAGAYDAACRSLIGPNDIQKDGDREFKKKSAWKKLARHFNISTSVVDRSERFLNDEATGESVFVATCVVRAVSPWGQAADGIGACGTDEESGRRKITIADAIATAETRASNRATSNLIAMGEVSAEETTRGQAQQVELVKKSLEEMTLEQAGAVPFPWKKPDKYRDKPLSELSLKMLNVVKDSVDKDIADKGETPARLELQRAAALLIAEKTKPAAAAETPAEVAAAPAPEAAPPQAPSPSLEELVVAGNKLLKHERITDDERRRYLERFASATSVEVVRDLIGELEMMIEKF
jgi:hypothetical protein